MAALFLAGLGAKLGLILHYSSPFPYLDQWPAEAIELFIPYLGGHYSPALLFLTRNEHHIVFTRLLELLLLMLNGQWDSQLEMLVNAVIQCAGVAAIGGLLASQLGKRYWPVLWAALALDLCLPFAWENTLWGFQSQFYFLIIFSLVAIWGLGSYELKSNQWWIGVVAAVLALGAMGSGFVAAATVIGVKLLEMSRRGGWRKQAVTLGFCGLIVVAGVLFLKKVPEHAQFRAQSIHDFVVAFAKNLAWPWPQKPWYAPLSVFPIAVLGWKMFCGREEPTGAERLILGMGIWVVLQAAIYAYGRGVGGMTPAWRYMDVLAFLALANGLSVVVLLERLQKSANGIRLWQGAFAIWVIGCLFGLWNLSSQAWRKYIPQFQHEQTAQLDVSRKFLATDNPAVFANKPGEELPVGNVDADVWLLRNPQVRSILPPCAFQTPRNLGPLSVWTSRILQVWPFLFAAGFCWYFCNLIQCWRAKVRRGSNAPAAAEIPE